MKKEIWILIVDDEATIRESLADVLTLKGFKVHAVENGVDALAYLENQKVDLVIADIMMPQMNGYQFYQRVRANPAWKLIPFLFLTAKGDPEDVRFGKELGADDYLKKPIEVEDLVAAVYGRLKRFDDLTVMLGDEVLDQEGLMANIISFGESHLLTPREIDVLEGMVAGKSNAEIATDLVVGITTVKTHVSNILGKLGAQSRSEVVSWVLKPGHSTTDSQTSSNSISTIDIPEE